MHARYLRYTSPLIHLCVCDAPEFGEEGVDYPSIVSSKRSRSEEVEREGVKQVNGLLDVVFETEWKRARYFCRVGEIPPEVFYLR